tara:strand:+ start:81 stop:560 length:480 start_codon:yes stop_codon:yes gene_type:complete
MYINYFNALKTLIKSNLNTVKTVDWFNEQYTRTEELKAIEYPAVYIEFGNPVFWKTGGDGMQYAETNITLHIVYFDVEDAPNTSLTLASDTHKLIHSKTLMNGDEQLTSSLVRTASELVTEYDQLKIIKLTYDCTLYDCSTMPVVTKVNPIDLNVSLRT